MERNELTRLVVGALEDVRGQDIKVLDVTSLTTMTDSMVIASGNSDRQVKALAESVVTRARESGIKPRGVEGVDQAEWILVDFGDVLVHIMQGQTRAFYQLEKLWDMPEAATESH